VSTTTWLRCIGAFSYMDGNVPVVVGNGDVIEASDPCVKGRAHHFEPLESSAQPVTDRGVEQATAAPGERRSVTRPVAKKTVVKKKA
jgi:hypothetical protein